MKPQVGHLGHDFFGRTAMLGGLGDYQQLKEAATQPAAETTGTTP